MTNRLMTAALVVALVIPASAEAQSGARIRASASGQSFVTGDYGNTDIGQAFDIALVGGRGNVKAGIGIEYGEYTITGEVENVVDAAVDLIFDIPLTGGVYMDLRLGVNANGWDVGNTRYTVGGARAGGALGYRYPIAGSLALDVAVTGSYLYGIYTTVGSEGVSEFNTDNIGDITGTRMGARVGLTLNPGVGR